MLEAFLDDRANIRISGRDVTFESDNIEELNFLPPRLRNSDAENSLHVLNSRVLELVFLQSIDMGLEKYSLDYKPRSLLPTRRAALRELTKYIEKFGLHNATIEPRLGVALEGKRKPSSDPLIAISGLQIVKTDDVSWEEIVEFRRDKESRRKLRQLRSFAMNNYSGKTRSYIEDDLLLRIDEYEAVIRKWRFATTDGVLSSLLNSKLLAGAGAGSLVSILCGAPLPAVLAAGAATVTELGKAALHIRKQNFELREALRNHPASYIAEARSRLDRS